MKGSLCMHASVPATHPHRTPCLRVPRCTPSSGAATQRAGTPAFGSDRRASPRQHARFGVRCSAVEESSDNTSEDEPPAPEGENEAPRKRRTRKADSTDPIATFMTRRFGLAGGLAWLGVLTFGVVSEQLKTRNEVAREESGTQAVDAKEVVTPSGLRYTDLVRGGGETAPQRGYLLAANVRVVLGEEAQGPVLFDTEDTGRPLAFFFGCEGGRWTWCDVVLTRHPFASVPGRFRARYALASKRPYPA